MAAVRAGAPGFLCAPATRRPLLFLVRALWVTSAAWPGPAPWPRPPTAYPVSYEVSAGPCLLGWEEAVRAPKPEADPVPWGVLGSITLCSSRGLGSPGSTPLLPCWPIDESRPLAWYRQWARIDLHGRTKVIQQAALLQARSPGSCGPRRQNCC